MNLKAILYSLGFYILTVTFYIFFSFIFPSLFKETFFMRIFLDSLLFGIPIFFIMLIILKKILNAEEEDSTLKIILKNLLLTFILAIVFFIMMHVFLFVYCKIATTCGQGIVFFSIRSALYISLYFIIINVFSVIFSKMIRYSKKLFNWIISLMIIISILGSFIIFAMSGFCLEYNVLCNTENALNSNNLERCGIDDGYCFGQVAAQKDDPSTCKELLIKEQKESCYVSYARASKDGSVCSLISTEYVKLNCCLWAFEGQHVPNQGGYNALTQEQKAICGINISN